MSNSGVNRTTGAAQTRLFPSHRSRRPVAKGLALSLSGQRRWEGTRRLSAMYLDPRSPILKAQPKVAMLNILEEVLQDLGPGSNLPHPSFWKLIDPVGQMVQDGRASQTIFDHLYRNWESVVKERRSSRKRVASDAWKAAWQALGMPEERMIRFVPRQTSKQVLNIAGWITNVMRLAWEDTTEIETREGGKGQIDISRDIQGRSREASIGRMPTDRKRSHKEESALAQVIHLLTFYKAIELPEDSFLRQVAASPAQIAFLMNTIDAIFVDSAEPTSREQALRTLGFSEKLIRGNTTLRGSISFITGSKALEAASNIEIGINYRRAKDQRQTSLLSEPRT